MVDYQRTTMCRMEFLRAPTRRPGSGRGHLSRAGAATTAPAHAHRATVDDEARRAGPGAAGPARRRPGAPQAVADRPRQARRAAVRQDHRRPRAGPRARPPVRPRLGPAAALAARRTRRTGRPTRSSTACVKVLAAWDWAAAADGGDGRRVRDPPAAGRLARRPAGRRSDGSPTWAVLARHARAIRRCPRPIPPTGWRGLVGAWLAPDLRRRRRPGPAARRPHRHRLDPHDGGPRAPRGGCPGGPAVCPGERQLRRRVSLAVCTQSLHIVR